MKRVKLLLIFIALFIILIPDAFASDETASIRVSANTKVLTVGNTVKVSVKVSSKDLGAWQYCISYDTKILKLTDSTADAFSCVKAGYVTTKGQKEKTETFTFKAIKSGSTEVSVKSAAVYAYSDEEQMKFTKSSVSIRSMTQAELEATYSTNAYLRSLTVGSYKLSPTFNKETLTYNVEVPNDITSININATKADDKSSIIGTGSVDLTEGNNRFEVVVTAQKGNSLTYVVNIYRKELDPIYVTINNQKYTVIRKSDDLSNYSTYELIEIDYDEFKIPALYSTVTDYTLIGLKDETGNIKMYIYENGIKEEYIEVKSNAITLYPQGLPENDNFQKYLKEQVNFNGVMVDAYKLDKSSKQAIIYGQNIETGKIAFYVYDTEEDTITLYRSDLEEFYLKQLELHRYVIFGFVIFSCLLLFIIIVRHGKNKKIKKEMKKQNKENKKEKEKKKTKEEDDKTNQ